MMVRRNCAAAMYVGRRDPHAFRNSIVVEGIDCWLGICSYEQLEKVFRWPGGGPDKGATFFDHNRPPFVSVDRDGFYHPLVGVP